jgi:hypothetical protein
MDLKILLSGFRELENKMEKIYPAIRDDLKKTMYQAASLVEAEAKTIITEIEWEDSKGEKRIGHIKTSTLKGSIQVVVGWDANGYELLGVIGTDVPYAPYIEMLPDGGFLVPALENKSEEAYEYLAKKIKEILENKI